MSRNSEGKGIYSRYLDDRYLLASISIDPLQPENIYVSRGYGFDTLAREVSNRFEAFNLTNFINLDALIDQIKDRFTTYPIAGGVTAYPPVCSSKRCRHVFFILAAAWVFRCWRLVFYTSPAALQDCINAKHFLPLTVTVTKPWQRLDAVLFVYRDLWVRRVAERCRAYGLQMPELDCVPIYVHPIQVEGVDFWLVNLSVDKSYVLSVLMLPLSGVRKLFVTVERMHILASGRRRLAERLYNLADGHIINLDRIARELGYDADFLRHWQCLYQEDKQAAMALASLYKL